MKRAAAGELFGGVFWRTVNISGTILIANACRVRLLPYFEALNEPPGKATGA